MRDSNEDRYLVRDGRRGTLIAVADGVGGVAGGEIASAAAVEVLGERFFGADGRLAPADALAAAMRETNDAVLSRAGESGQKSAASTLVAAAIDGRDVVVGNLGDSRAYVIRRGAIRRITADHSGDHPSSITRFVGDPRGVQPDVFVEPLAAGDRLLLCSDGLTRHLSDEDIAAGARSGDLQKSVDGLVALANERGGEDNITVVLYAARARFAIADLGNGVINMILAALVVVVIVGTIAALVVATGALPSTP